MSHYRFEFRMPFWPCGVGSTGGGRRVQAGKTVFAQWMDFIPLHEFRRCVNRYGGNYKVSTFSC